jgi:hypothetical protein
MKPASHLSRAVPGSKSICRFFIALGGLYFALSSILFLQLHGLALFGMLGSVAEGPKFRLKNI